MLNIKRQVRALIERAERLQQAFSVLSNLDTFIFHLGYQKFCLPKWFRRKIAKTSMHQAWLSGYYGGGIWSVLERHPPYEEGPDPRALIDVE